MCLAYEFEDNLTHFFKPNPTFWQKANLNKSSKMKTFNSYLIDSKRSK